MTRGERESQTVEPNESRGSDRLGGFNYQGPGAELLKNLE